MRALLILGLIGAAALTVAFGGAAYPAPMNDFAPMSNVERAPPDADGRSVFSVVRNAAQASSAERDGKAASESFAAAAGKIVVLAGAGLVGTLAAVGLRRLWVWRPIRDPYWEGPA